jgi:hypothetical protein
VHPERLFQSQLRQSSLQQYHSAATARKRQGPLLPAKTAWTQKGPPLTALPQNQVVHYLSLSVQAPLALQKQGKSDGDGCRHESPPLENDLYLEDNDVHGGVQNTSPLILNQDLGPFSMALQSQQTRNASSQLSEAAGSQRSVRRSRSTRKRQALDGASVSSKELGLSATNITPERIKVIASRSQSEADTPALKPKENNIEDESLEQQQQVSARSTGKPQ